MGLGCADCAAELELFFWACLSLAVWVLLGWLGRTGVLKCVQHVLARTWMGLHSMCCFAALVLVIASAGCCGSARVNRRQLSHWWGWFTCCCMPKRIACAMLLGLVGMLALDWDVWQGVVKRYRCLAGVGAC